MITLMRKEPTVMRHRVSLLALALCLVGAPALLGQSDTGKPTAVLLSGPEVGRRAPNFSLPWANKDGVGPAESPYELWGDLGRTIVVAFYPRDFTKSCTAELQTFTEQYDSLFGPDVVVVGISTDPPETHSRFAASLNAPFRLLSDPGQRVARKYGSYDRSGFPRPTVYVIGADGKVKYRNMHFNALDPQHYKALGAAVRAARGS
jgi:peroxiredoxin Q/BCP